MKKTSNRGQKNSEITIGLLLHDLMESFNVALWAGVENAAKKANAHLICFAGGEINSPYSVQVKRNVICEFIDKTNVDGLVLASNILSNYIGVSRFQEYCKQFHPLPITSIGIEMEQKGKKLRGKVVLPSKVTGILFTRHGPVDLRSGSSSVCFEPMTGIMP